MLLLVEIKHVILERWVRKAVSKVLLTIIIVIPQQALRTSHQSLATSHQALVTSHQAQATSHQAPATSHQAQATSHQAQAMSHQAQATQILESQSLLLDRNLIRASKCRTSGCEHLLEK